jgi:hypothetical protein
LIAGCCYVAATKQSKVVSCGGCRNQRGTLPTQQR